jgi:hypothetical protein
LATQFDSENWFAAGTSISTANATSLHPTRFWQQMLIALQVTRFRQRITLPLQTTQLQQRTLIHCRQHNFDNELDSLQTTQFGIENLFCRGQHNVAANT